jgi:2-dehydro-3-deoxy-D-arabinonate dehydratase
MRLFKTKTPDGPDRWVLEAEGLWRLPTTFTLGDFLGRQNGEVTEELRGTAEPIRELEGPVVAPVDATTEVWAAGVTYKRSHQARMGESKEPDIYDRVYVAQRPELFFKATGWRVMGHDEPIGIRADSTWDVPEPELAIVLNAQGHIVGLTICNDVSSRSIEAENPLYLPQAKMYSGSSALGPGILLTDPSVDTANLAIAARILRQGETIWSETASTSELKRSVTELATALFAADIFPHGAILSTGTCLVPQDDLTLQAGDVVEIEIDGVGVLRNPVVLGLDDSVTTAASHRLAAGVSSAGGQ